MKKLYPTIVCTRFRRPDMPYRVFNTWMGDPTKIVLLDAILKVIKRDNLFSVVEKSGDVLMSGLRDLESEYPALINSTRGRGTFITFDATDAKLRDDIIERLKTKGQNTILCACRAYLFSFLKNLNAR